MEYRREIDGLRALAVLPVILFHAGLDTFSGGFVGVDVFFVISGYLITTIILSELERGKFSIVNFYERRARRILPALFLVMLVCIPFAWFWLLPSDMKDFSQSLVAVSFFASNVLFWRESGYFDTAAELKPLLHTWSLAVEEQYYVLFPLFLMIAWRFGKRWTLLLLSAAFLAGIALAQWASVTEPAAAFYLLPTRAWELLIGAFAAFYLSTADRAVFSRGTSEFCGWFGLGLILFSVFTYSKAVPFPGFFALVPTVGAVLIILFARQQTSIGRFIGNKAFVGVGLLSYSAYLWHQPLFAFARHRGVTEHDTFVFLSLSVLSMILAYFSWRYVEAPFRSRMFFDRARIFIFASVGTVFFAALGMVGYHKDGDLGQTSEAQKVFLEYFANASPDWQYDVKKGLVEKYRHECNFYDIAKYQAGRPTNVPRESISPGCYASGKNSNQLVFIWGDSHAQQLNHGLRESISGDYDILQVASSGCVAQLDAVESKVDYCQQSNWFALEKIKELKPKVVIVGQNLKHTSKGMDKISRALRDAGVRKVIFTGPTPHWSPSLPAVIASRFVASPPRHTFSGLDKGVIQLDERLKAETSSLPHVNYVSLIDYFCGKKGCLVYYGDDVAEGVTTWDFGHLTPIASYQFSKDVLAKMVVD